MCTENCNCGCGSGMWVPRDSKLSFKINKDNPADLFIETTVIPPLGYIYAGYDENDDFYASLPETPCTISCKCTVQKPEHVGACDPTVLNNQLSCVGDPGCETCKSVNSIAISPTTTVDFVRGGFLNLGIPVTFIDNSVIELPATFAAMFEVPEVSNILETFLSKIYRGAPQPPIFNGGSYLSAPEGYSFAMVNLCGRAAPVVVPNATFNSAIYGAKETVAANTIKCSCNLLAHACKPNEYHTTRGGTCFGDCTQHENGVCTMSICKFVGDGGIRVVAEAHGFLF